MVSDSSWEQWHHDTCHSAHEGMKLSISTFWFRWELQRSLNYEILLGGFHTISVQVTADGNIKQQAGHYVRNRMWENVGRSSHTGHVLYTHTHTHPCSVTVPGSLTAGSAFCTISFFRVPISQANESISYEQTCKQEVNLGDRNLRWKLNEIWERGRN